MELSAPACPEDCDCDPLGQLTLTEGVVSECSVSQTQLIQPHEWNENGGLYAVDLEGDYYILCKNDFSVVIQDTHHRSMRVSGYEGGTNDCAGLTAYHSSGVSLLIENVTECTHSVFDVAYSAFGRCYCYIGPTDLIQEPLINRTLTFWDSFTEGDTDCVSYAMVNTTEDFNISSLSIGCNTAVCEQLCPDAECSGSELYCVAYGCKTSGCFCTLASVNSEDLLTPNQIWVTAPFSYEEVNLAEDPPCSLRVTSEILVICEADLIVELVWGHNRTVLTTVNRMAVYPIPVVFVPTSLVLSELTLNGSVYQDTVVLFPASTQKDSFQAPCWFCWSAYTNWDRMSDFDRFMSIMIATIFFVLAIASIGWLLMVLFWACGLCGWTGAKLWGCCVLGVKGSRHAARYTIRQYRSMKKQTDPKADEEESVQLDDDSGPESKEKEISLEVKPTRRYSSGGTRIKTLTTAALLAGSGARAQSFSCAMGATVQSSIAVCAATATNISCANTANMLFSIPTTQQSACLTWNNTQGAPVQTSKIEYTSLEYEVTLASEYFTSAWTGVSYSSKSCWTPSNWCGPICDNMNSSDPFGHGQVNGVTTGLPGRTGCYRSCGCAGCDCFYCNTACVAYRWAAQPNGETCEILGLSSGEFHPIISISTGNVNHTFVVRSSLQELEPNFKFSVVSTSFPTPPTFQPFKIMRCASGVFAVLASPANQGQPNTIGDIQGPTSGAFTSPTSSSFNVVSNLATPQFHQSSVTHQFTASGLATVERHRLPYIINGLLWTYQDGKIRTNLTSPFGLILSAEADGFITSRQFDAVCPEVEFVTGSGCYGCYLNASVFTIRGHSSCLRGTCTVSTQDPHLTIISQTVTFELTDTLIPISIIASAPDIDTDLTFTCSGSTVILHVNATLIPLSLWELQQNGTNGNSTVVTGSSGSLSFKGFAFGSPLRSFISSIVIMGIVAAAIFVGALLWKYLPRPNKTKTL